jgi:hypothetical protein
MDCETPEQERLLSRNALELAAMRGGADVLKEKRYSAMTAEVIGVLSKGFTVSEAARLLKVSRGTVQRSRDHIALATIDPTAAGPFSTLRQKPGGTKTRISDIERHATITWFMSMNPARSGDTKPIAWMLLEKVDFYFDQYRKNYGSLMKMAVTMYPELRALATTVANDNWERNIQKHLRNPLTPTKLYEQEMPKEQLTAALARAANGAGQVDESPHSMPVSVDASEVADQFSPRCYEVFYFNILKQTSIRKRPPEKYCEMCEGGHALQSEKLNLQALLAPSDPEDANSDKEEEKSPDIELWRWGKHKDRAGATKRLKELKILCAKRDQHAVWYRRQRPEVTDVSPYPNHSACWFILNVL